LGARERLARLAARDGFRFTGQLGHGPRSTVYDASHGPFKQRMAVKVFAAGACTREEWEARLRHGADLWATLAHPQVVAVHRAGWWDGAAYVATEYVPNGSLAAKLTGRPHPIRTALQLVEQLTEVVAYLHRQGVVHGNLKPSNVLLAADGIPRVTDFRLTGGLFHRPLAPDTVEPAGIGYLTPEGLRDPAAEARPFTDIYGLGLILYELLTGRPPFAAKTAQELREQVCSQDPAPPSQRNREVTPPLEATCLRCLRKNPWGRFTRAYDLLMRLRQIRDNPEDRGASDPRRPPRRPSAAD
jgi:serine/threonine protein kinase